MTSQHGFISVFIMKKTERFCVFVRASGVFSCHSCCILGIFLRKQPSAAKSKVSTGAGCLLITHYLFAGLNSREWLCAYLTKVMPLQSTVQSITGWKADLVIINLRGGSLIVPAALTAGIPSKSKQPLVPCQFRLGGENNHTPNPEHAALGDASAKMSKTELRGENKATKSSCLLPLAQRRVKLEVARCAGVKASLRESWEMSSQNLSWGLLGYKALSPHHPRLNSWNWRSHPEPNFAYFLRSLLHPASVTFVLLSCNHPKGKNWVLHPSQGKTGFQ